MGSNQKSAPASRTMALVEHPRRALANVQSRDSKCPRRRRFFMMGSDRPMPQRIQLRRTKGWRMPENTVKVDRTTPWGNPFVVGKPGGAYSALVKDRRHAYLLYKSIAFDNEKLVTAAREQLRGKNLACWCSKDDPYEDCCHAAVLLEIANSD